jgi:hypothetical protein
VGVFAAAFNSFQAGEFAVAVGSSLRRGCLLQIVKIVVFATNSVTRTEKYQNLTFKIFAETGISI